MGRGGFFRGVVIFAVLLVLLLVLSYAIQRWRISLLRGTYVGIVALEGEITPEKSREFINCLSRARDDDRVGAILVRINSPGGGVAPSQEVYRAIMDMRREKRVVASIGTVGASGGYYVAAAANEIYADPGSITGSIGVLFAYPQLQELLKKLGVGKVVVKSGKYKDLASPFRSPTPQEKAILQGVVNDIYQQFVGDVARARGMKRGELEALSDGRIFTGKQAQALGLVDGLKTQEEVIRYISSNILKVRGRPRVLVFKKKEGWRGLFQRTRGMFNSLLFGTYLWEVR